MPNWCTTNIWLRCPDEKTAIAVETKINDLLSKQFIPNGFDSKDYFCWLGNIVGNAGFVDDSSTDDGLIYRCRGSVTFVGIDPAGDIENTNTVLSIRKPRGFLCYECGLRFWTSSFQEKRFDWNMSHRNLVATSIGQTDQISQANIMWNTSIRKGMTQFLLMLHQKQMCSKS